MAFNPTTPVNGSEIKAQELRDKFNELNNRLDWIRNAPEPDPDFVVSNPPTQAEVQTIYDTLHDLVMHLRAQ
jgi:hypothetical protein